ncbi:MAG: ABC transporter substrate-binding protein [Micrococcales bacterium]|nr:ABC transporter substrate-binding protein [Micrococcales bacterium]
MKQRSLVHRLRSVAAAAVAVLAAASLAGCSGSPQGATRLDKKANVSLTWWTGQSASAEKVLEGLAADFEKLNPNVTINVQSGAASTDQLLQKLSAGFASGTFPDISYAYGSWASQLEASGRTQDITAQVAKPGVRWSEFAGAARKTARPTGQKTIGFPALVDNISLFYNKTVFDKAGLGYPTNEWTWDQFRSAAKKLTDPANGTYGYGYSVSGSEETTWQFWPHLWQNGGSILSPDQTKAQFASPAGVKSLTLLRDMAVEDRSVYLDQTDVKFAQLFESDRIGMITSGPWELSALKTAKTKYGVAYLPGTNGNHQTVSGPDLWVLFDQKDKNRAYWSYEFTEWLTSAPVDLKWNVKVGNLPLRSSEINSTAFQNQEKVYPGITLLAENANNATTARPTTQGYVGVSTAIGKAISNVMQGKGTPQSALKAAQEQADQALAKG